jgi:hypothetical protein
MKCGWRKIMRTDKDWVEDELYLHLGGGGQALNFFCIIQILLGLLITTQVNRKKKKKKP